MMTFGSDPEFFIFNEEDPISSLNVLQGDVNNRIKISGHEFYSDNVLAECAIIPSKTKKETIKNFKSCFKIFNNLVKPYKLVPKASAVFPENQLIDEKSKIVGCSVDFCAYQMKQMGSPSDKIMNEPLRSAGGHIHVGSDLLIDDDQSEDAVLFIYMMDLFVGVPSLWLDKDPTSKQRRELYGNAGRYRPKDYGMEYRSLSNFWLQSPELTSLIYDLTEFCLSLIENGKAWTFWEFDYDKGLDSGDLKDCWNCKKYDPDILQHGINNTDKRLLSEIFDLAKRNLPEKIRDDLERLQSKENYGDFYCNWKID